MYSTGTMRPSVVGTTYLAFRDIARMKTTKTYSEEGDVVTLPLLRRSGRTQGSIEVFVNLTGATIQQMMYALGKSLVFPLLSQHDTRTKVLTEFLACSSNRVNPFVNSDK